MEENSKKLQSTSELKKVMQNYFDGFANAPKIAWCTSVGPAELLRAFGFEVYFPENHGALLGATRTAGEHIPSASSCGYSSAICSYTTSDIGAYLNNTTPLQKHYGLKHIPKPDLIVYNTNQCREVEDWFSFFSKTFNCPIVGVHPPRYLDEVSKSEIKLVVEQFKKIIPSCEKVTGNKFHTDRFSETIDLSKRASDLWQKVLNTSQNIPAPLNFFDATIHMGPIVVLRGTQQAVDYYTLLLKEINEKLKTTTFSKNGNCRIFWDGMPIWGKLRTLSDLFAQNNSEVVASTYCNSWIFDDLDSENPFESSALAYTNIFINRSEKAKLKILQHWINSFSVDGIIFHDAKTCFNNSNAHFGLPLRLKNTTGIPYLIIEGDLCDLRFFSEGQSITKIETFIEQLESKKIIITQRRKDAMAYDRK